MKSRRVIWNVGALLLLAAIAFVFWQSALKDLDWPRSPERAVFQIDSFLGKPSVSSWREIHVPDLTVFGDGRVIFVRVNEKTHYPEIYEARIPEPQLRRLLLLAQGSLASLDRSYSSTSIVDGTTTWFSVVTAKDTRTVGVYGLDELFNVRVRLTLGVLDRAFHLALPVNAVRHTPEKVKLIATPVGDSKNLTEVQAWPADYPPLPALGPGGYGKAPFQGTAAKDLLRWLQESPTNVFRSGGQPYYVSVTPDIPVLHQPWP